MAPRRKNDKQGGRHGPGRPGASNNNNSDLCGICGKGHKGPCYFAQGKQRINNGSGKQVSQPCTICSKRHRGPCRQLQNNSMLPQVIYNAQKNNRPNTVSCQNCGKMHTGTCRLGIKPEGTGIKKRQTRGREALVSLRVVTSRLRQYDGQIRVEHFILDEESGDALMCYCDGNAPFCVKHYAEKLASRNKDNITQTEVAGMRAAMWSNYCSGAFAEPIAIAYTSTTSIMPNVDPMDIPFQCDMPEDVDADVVGII